MIIKQETGSEAQVIGDIENNKVGIDRQNIDFIATLLTSNLYSKPFESFLRETISNAYDAQVENGNPEHTIYLLIQNENGKERFSIRDYGTGISPERFNTIYNKIGSSTKRTSNDFIGGFGIGKFAGLSVSDIVEIKSFYNGVLYDYLMYKNNGGIQIDKVNEGPTDEENGVEVSIIVPNAIRDYRERQQRVEAIKNMAFFENLFVIDNTGGYDAFEFNDRTNYITDDWAYSSIIYNTFIKLGRVVYPLRNVKFPLARVGINIPIGSIMVTPNREDIIYSTDTQNYINEVCQRAKEDMYIAVAKSTIEQYPNIVDQFIYFNFDEPYLKVNNDLKIRVNMYGTHEKRQILQRMGYGPQTAALFDTSILSASIIRVEQILKNGSWTTRVNSLPNTRSMIKSQKAIIIKKIPKFGLREKRYIMEKYAPFEGSIVISPMMAKYNVLKTFKSYIQGINPIAPSVLKSFIREVIKKLNIIVLDENTVPADFKIKREPSPVIKSETLVYKEDLTALQIDVYTLNGYSVSYTRESFKNFNRFRSREYQVVYVERKRELPEEWYNYIKAYALSVNSKDDHIIFIGVPSKLIPLLTNKRYIPFDEWIKKPNRHFKRVVTAQILNGRFKVVEGLSEYRTSILPIPTQLHNKIYGLRAYINRLGTLAINQDIVSLYKKNNWLDFEALSDYTLTEDEAQVIKTAEKVYANCAAYLMAFTIKNLDNEVLKKLPYGADAKYKSTVILNNNN
jgi:Histidine kinase-, DNA gyrase B-, and HSP90-like ATPase